MKLCTHLPEGLANLLENFVPIHHKITSQGRHNEKKYIHELRDRGRDWVRTEGVRMAFYITVISHGLSSETVKF